MFDWAEHVYPEFFSPAGGASANFMGYCYRYYGTSLSYLATQAENFYYLGPLHDNSNTIWELGPLAGWLGLAGCNQ